MKICIAQTAPLKGTISVNIEAHNQFKIKPIGKNIDNLDLQGHLPPFRNIQAIIIKLDI